FFAQSDFFSFPLLAAIALWALWACRRQRPTLLAICAVHTLAVLSYIPFVGLTLDRSHKFLVTIGQSGWWIPVPGIRPTAFFLKAIAYGYSDQPIFLHAAF